MVVDKKRFAGGKNASGGTRINNQMSGDVTL